MFNHIYISMTVTALGTNSELSDTNCQGKINLGQIPTGAKHLDMRISIPILTRYALIYYFIVHGIGVPTLNDWDIIPYTNGNTGYTHKLCCWNSDTHSTFTINNVLLSNISNNLYISYPGNYDQHGVTLGTPDDGYKIAGYNPIKSTITITFY